MRSVLSLLTGVVAVIATAVPASAANTYDIVVKTDTDTASANAASGTGGAFTKRVSPDTVVVSVPAASAEAAAAAVSARPGVVWAEEDKPYVAARAVNDPCYAPAGCGGRTQWGLSNVGATQAWDTTTGDRNIKIAVLDSGVDINHPELSGHASYGPNFSTDNDLSDAHGHGTHVAGTLGASTDNGSGIAGMAWNASITSVKVLDQDGAGTSSTVAAGLRWAADNGMRIANMSLVGDATQTVLDAVNYARARGVLMVAAAGNESATTPRFPAAFPGVISVGASVPSDSMASFSNRGSWVDVLAPGANILSLWPTNLDPSDPYSIESGTSMATPFVSGAAALLWSSRPYLSAEGVTDRLLGTAKQVSGSGTLVASGRLDVAAALGSGPAGYRMAATDGGIFSYGASFNGSTGGQKLNKPIVTMMTPGKPDGYWLVASDGGVFSFGGANFYGSAGGTKLNQPIVSSASSRSGTGYWLAARDGGVFSYGDAAFFGSAGAQKLNQPIVAMMSTATGQGYWLIAADGGVFSYGDAKFFGSTGNIKLNSPIVGAARSPRGNGYWLTAADGGIFAFGDAQFYGSAGGIKLAKPVVAMTPTPSGAGYWLTASDGGVFSYGDATFKGSTGNISLNQPIVAVTSTP